MKCWTHTTDLGPEGARRKLRILLESAELMGHARSTNFVPTIVETRQKEPAVDERWRYRIPEMNSLSISPDKSGELHFFDCGNSLSRTLGLRVIHLRPSTLSALSFSVFLVSFLFRCRVWWVTLATQPSWTYEAGELDGAVLREQRHSNRI